jgi:hypothetical protein
LNLVEFVRARAAARAVAQGQLSWFAAAQRNGRRHPNKPLPLHGADLAFIADSSHLATVLSPIEVNCRLRM